MSWICNKCETSNPESAIECEVCSSIAPSVKSISYSDVDIPKQTTIAWVASDCDKITLSFNEKEYDVTDKTEFDILVTKNTNVTFYVSNTVTSRTFVFPIHIKRPEIADFCIDKLSAYENEKILLTWNVKNCINVKIEGLGEFAPIGNIKVSATNRKYKLIAENSAGKVHKEVEVKIFKSPDIEFKLSIHKLRKGSKDSSRIDWKIKNYSSAKILINDKEEEIKSPSGSKIISPTESTKYNLQVTGLDKKKIFTKEVFLEVLPESKITFESDKPYTLPQVPIVLNWSVENAKSVELTGFGRVKSIDNKIVTINKDTTYTLKVEDEFGVKEKTIKIKMLPLPVIKSILVPTPKIENTVNVHQYVPKLGVDVRIEVPHIEIPEYNPLSVEFNKEDVELRNTSIEWNELVEMEKLNIRLHESSLKHVFGNVYNKLNSKIKQLWKK